MPENANETIRASRRPRKEEKKGKESGTLPKKGSCRRTHLLQMLHRQEVDVEEAINAIGQTALLRPVQGRALDVAGDAPLPARLREGVSLCRATTGRSGQQGRTSRQRRKGVKDESGQWRVEGREATERRNGDGQPWTRAEKARD